MTKAEAVASFKEGVMPGIRDQYERDGVPDWPARREAWNNYTDMLQKDGMITMHQYSTWTHPPITSGNPVDWSRFSNPLGA